MYLCYVDESGTPDLPGNTSHYVLAGISIPVWHWKTCDAEIERIKVRYDIAGEEIHVAWLLRSYIEQSKIPGFTAMSASQRRSAVSAYRKTELLRLQRVKNPKHYHRTRKVFRETDKYVHLLMDERQNLALELARCIS